jgi:hypothetical protein
MCILGPMDREQESEHLKKAERHVAEAKELVERQRQRVQELVEAGHGTEIADATLHALEANLKAFERHRDLILGWLRDESAPPSEGGSADAPNEGDQTC